MTSADDSLPDDVAILKAMLLAERAARTAAQAEAQARTLEIEKFAIARLRHERFGQSSERGTMLEQLELALTDLEEDASEAEAAAAQMAASAAAAEKVKLQPFERRKPARRPLPEHLPRERIVYPAPSSCPCCGGALRKLGEDVTETLEVVPRQWKVIQHVREKFSCRSCEAITQAQRHRPACVARRCPGQTARSSRETDRRAASLELENASTSRRRLRPRYSANRRYLWSSPASPAFHYPHLLRAICTR